MKLRKTLLCGVAATALGLAAALPTNSSILPSLTTPAQAQVQASVSIGFGTFYDSLAPHGDWVRLEGRHVWVPGDVRADWRPYTVGRWAYTRPHGWTWVSDEPYGWAVYHYGRWGFQHNIGWYWVPGTEWAPAWVTWRGSGDYTAWAPMPPRGLVQISYDVDPYAIPARYWVAVPTNRFLAPNLFNVAIHIGQPNFYDVVRHTRPIGHVRVVNNIAVNTTINVNYIEEVTGEDVRIRQVNYAQEPSAARLGDDAVQIYAPAVEEEPDAEPQQVRSLEEIDREVQAADEQADQPVEVADDAPELPEEAVVENPAPVTEEDVAEDAQPDEVPGEDVAEDAQPDEVPGEDVAEDAQPDEVPGEDVAEDAQPDEVPGEDVAEDAQPDEVPGEDVAEDAQPDEVPGEDVADEAQPDEAPGQDVAEEAQPDEAPAAAAEQDAGPQVEERAIGEPQGQGQPQAQPQGQQGQGQEQRQQRGQGEGNEEELPQ